ncbi:MAG: type VI secretion system tip protein TssI/VgrG [Pseudomonadota bacterium]
MASLSNKLAANKKFEFSSQAFDADKFSVVNMTGFESISKPFRFMLTLVSDDAGIDFDKVLQSAATFRIFSPDGTSSTPYHGGIAEFDQLQQTDGYVFYRAVLVPRLWHLSLYQMSEVYLNDQSIPQIIEKVLKGSRLTSADYELKLSGSYRERSFVCQYQETHLDFVSRWMEKEGMYFFFDHEGRSEKLVIVDNKSMHPAQAVKVLYRPVDQKDTGASADSVQDFVCRQKPLPRQVILRDYNHRKATVELKVTEPVSDNGIGEVNLYGENFRNEAEGQRYAKLRAEEILCGGKVFTGEATAVGLRSGYMMEMARHYRDSFNGQYLVTEVHHEGSQAAALLAGIKTSYSEGQGGETTYRNTFRAIPAAAQFRPERTTPRPRVSGTMNATIDASGPSQYAELDEYGQYKVQLPFDSTDKDAGKGSARVRMASPYSGSDHGMNFPLHKDAEVLLSFIDGNPDEPVILGAVPNSENPSVVNQANPYENKITTAGGNIIHMGDQKGKEVMWLHSPFHNSTLGLGSIDPKGGGSLWQSTGGSSESVTVGTKNDLYLGFKNSASLSFDNSFAAGLTNKMTIGSTVSVGVGFDVSWKMGKSVEFDDSTKYSLKSDAKLQGAEKVLISGGQRMAVKAAVETAKTVLRVAVGTSMALNAVAAGGAGKYISLAADEKGNKDKDGKYTGKTKAWDDGNNVNAARGIGAAAGVVTAGAVAATMIAAAKTFAAVGSPESVYASNILVDDNGIAMAVDSLLPVRKSGITIKNGEVGLSSFSAAAAGTSSLKVLPSEIKLSGNGVPGLTSNLNLSATAATLSTANPAGEVGLTQPTGGSVKLAAAGLTATSGAAKLELQVAAGATLQGGATCKLSLLPAAMTADCSGSKLMLKAAVAVLSAAGTGISLNASGAKVNGALIQLG